MVSPLEPGVAAGPFAGTALENLDSDRASPVRPGPNRIRLAGESGPVGLRFQLADGKAARLSEGEVDALCDVLWSSGEKGALTIVGKIVHERQKPPVLQEAVKLSVREGLLFREVVDRARR